MFSLVTRGEKEKSAPGEITIHPVMYAIAIMVSLVSSVYVSHTMLFSFLKNIAYCAPLIHPAVITKIQKISTSVKTLLQLWIGLGFYTINYNDCMGASEILQDKIKAFVNTSSENNDVPHASLDPHAVPAYA
jgi:hypothetical protein